ncbi:MAG: hypothetical protein E7604_03455 [Ruminococcaceae bacterium]|nr:hypothetical protein [Oscillospiraceae bacterium]
MKFHRRFFLTVLLLLGLGLVLCACQSDGNPDAADSSAGAMTDEDIAADSADGASVITVHGVDYTDTVLDEGDIKRWANENDLDNEACSMPGIIVSPYFSMTANGVDIPVFAERTANGPHNLAYIEVDGVGEDGVFSLNVELEAHTERKDPVVLPESSGVTAVSDGKKTTARITSFGSYTFTFDKGLSNDGSALPLTVMVKPKELSEYANYKTREIEPGTYPLGELDLSTPGSLYYFKKGVYEIDCINIATGNIIVYFEPGTLLVAKPLTLDENGTPMAQHVIAGWGQFGVKILGHAAVDLSYRPRTGVIFSFDKMSLLEFGGLNVVNSNNWTCCFTGCEDMVIRDLALIGYKTYSDGVMLSDCKNVTVDGCFVRTGDDALEVKSTSDGSVRTENVLFQNNAVWTDKGIAYGCVYESNFSQSGVTWKNNSVGYALANWSQHLGCATISINGADPFVEDYDMHFADLEIYYSRCPVITLVMHNGGSIHDIHFENITAKEVKLNSAVSKSYIDIWIKNEDGGALTDFVLDNLYFDNISYNETALTADNADDEIRFSVPNDYPVDHSILHINTK